MWRIEGLGHRIRIARGKHTQEELASILNVDRTTLGSWEIDRREPDLENLIKIAAFADVSLDWLAGRLNNTSIEQAQAYNNPDWHKFIDFAVKYKATPEKLQKLLKAALALKA